MLLHVERGYLLVRWGAVSLVAEAPQGPRLLAVPGGVLVATGHRRAAVSLYWAGPFDDEPRLLDASAWDTVLDAGVNADRPLQVSNSDGSPPLEDEPWLTDGPGSWRLRVYQRVNGWIDDGSGLPPEDVFVQLWAGA